VFSHLNYLQKENWGYDAAGNAGRQELAVGLDQSGGIEVCV
jgi:hypothetical protein